MPTAFIIHGHYDPANEALEAFVSNMGIDVVSFDRAGSRRGSISTVLTKVLDGVKNADVVIVCTKSRQLYYRDRCDV